MNYRVYTFLSCILSILFFNFSLSPLASILDEADDKDAWSRSGGERNSGDDGACGADPPPSGAEWVAAFLGESVLNSGYHTTIDHPTRQPISELLHFRIEAANTSRLEGSDVHHGTLLVCHWECAASHIATFFFSLSTIVSPAEY